GGLDARRAPPVPQRGPPLPGGARERLPPVGGGEAARAGAHRGDPGPHLPALVAALAGALAPGVPRVLRVLALASYPVEAAATRYRLVPFLPPPPFHGVSLGVWPVLDPRPFASPSPRAGLARPGVGGRRAAPLRGR